MKIHSSTITIRDIHEAVPPRCYLANFYNRDGKRCIIDTLGSRSHEHAYVVRLSGSSRYVMSGLPDKSATWTEWGNFIATLFRLDPEAKIGHYKTLADFMRITQDDAARMGEDAPWLVDDYLLAVVHGDAFSAELFRPVEADNA